jgi:hypothetical protein
VGLFSNISHDSGQSKVALITLRVYLVNARAPKRESAPPAQPFTPSVFRASHKMFFSPGLHRNGAFCNTKTQQKRWPAEYGAVFVSVRGLSFVTFRGSGEAGFEQLRAYLQVVQVLGARQ